MSNSLQRILVAAIAIPAAIGIVYIGGLPFALLVALLAGLGVSELFALARAQGIRPLAPLGIGAAAIFPLGVWWRYGGSFFYDNALNWLGAASVLNSFPNLIAGWVLITLTATLARRTPTDRPTAVAAITFLGPLYCGALPAFLLGIRYAVGPGRSWPATWVVFFPLAITWICDTAAMYGGKVFKGPKLAPTVSPGKTRSGAVSGVVGGIVAALVYHRLALVPSGIVLPTLQIILFGAVLAVTAQVGDLAESLIKREAGVKDSSHLIPGHGGVLDRLDSLYFVIPVAAMLYQIMGVI
ncbi:MAG: CDP-archaeol synthase [Gemmatimonadota bacterium]